MRIKDLLENSNKRAVDIIVNTDYSNHDIKTLYSNIIGNPAEFVSDNKHDIIKGLLSKIKNQEASSWSFLDKIQDLKDLGANWPELDVIANSLNKSLETNPEFGVDDYEEEDDEENNNN